MKDVGQIKQRADYLRSLYSVRDRQYEINWHAYHGEWDRIDKLRNQENRNVLSDERRRRSDSYQNWNLLKPIVDHTVMVLSRLPAIQVPSPDPKSEAAISKARKIEHALYGLWDESGMDQVHATEGFNLGCFGSSVETCLPDLKEKRPRLSVRQPGHCYPAVKPNGVDFQYVIFRWMEDLEILMWRYPHLKKSLSSKGGRYSKGQVEVIEYIDDKDYGMIIEGEWHPAQPGYTHDLGYVPVTITPALKLPGNNLFGPSDVDQLIAVNTLMNGLQTKLFDALEENLYPSHFTRGEEEPVIDRAPGAWNHLPPGTEVIETEPPSIPDEVFHSLDRATQFVRTHANWSEAWSGQSSQSVTTGKAVQRLQGPAEGMAALRQGFMAASWQRQNRYLLRMLEKLWPDEEMELEVGGIISNLSAPGRPTNQLVKLRPKEEIDGYYRNSVLYSTFGSDFATTSSHVQQLVASGLASKAWARKQLPGMHDEEEMREEIEREKRKDMGIELELQDMMAEKESQRRMREAEQQAQLAQGAEGGGEGAPAGGGGPPAEGGGPPAGGGGAPPGGGGGAMGGVSMLPRGRPQAMGIGEPLSGEENFPLPFTDVKPFKQALGQLTGEGGGQEAPPGVAGQPPEAAAREPEGVDPRRVTSDDVVEALQSIQQRIESGDIRSRSGGLRGDVYMLGELATRGMTQGQIELGITVAADQQLIVNALERWKGRLNFTRIEGERIPANAVKVVEGGEVAVPAKAQGPAGGPEQGGAPARG